MKDIKMLKVMLVAVFVIGVAFSGYNAYKYQIISNKVAEFNDAIRNVKDQREMTVAIKNLIDGTQQSVAALSSHAQTVNQSGTPPVCVGNQTTAANGCSSRLGRCSSRILGICVTHFQQDGSISENNIQVGPGAVVGGLPGTALNFLGFNFYSNTRGGVTWTNPTGVGPATQTTPNTNQSDGSNSNRPPSTSNSSSQVASQGQTNSSNRPPCDALCTLERNYNSDMDSYWVLANIRQFGATIDSEELSYRRETAFDSCVLYYSQKLNDKAKARNQCTNELSSQHQWDTESD